MQRTLSTAELCAETGASPDRIEWLTRIGILQPSAKDRYTFGDAFRVRMIGSLFEAGFEPEQIEAAVAHAGLNLQHVDRYVFHEPATRSGHSFADVAAELGSDGPRHLAAAYQLFGLTPPDPDSHLPADEEALLREFVEVWSLGDEEAPLRAARLVGDGTRTATAGWADLLYEQIAGPARERWLRKEIDHYPAEVTDAVARMFRLLPRLMEWLIQRNIEQIVTSGIADNFEEVLASRGLGPPPEPPNPPAVVFVDITGYTTVTEERGDDAAVRIATGLQRRADQVAVGHGGRVVKLLGDGAMLHFRDVSGAVEAAGELVSTLSHDLGVEAHAGVHAGRVIERDRDLFGATVNLAARVAGAAGPGEVLVTERVARLAGLGPERVAEVGHAPLKGVADPVRLFRLTPPSAGGAG
ncbi:MAG TPA: adenylate/guanylate cyclase domain-containing protein [Actinomycetota bacterium]|nr:adenylate/guanylate cyclase domain-containing protein [Actinomycetota bacterium]